MSDSHDHSKHPAGDPSGQGLKPNKSPEPAAAGGGGVEMVEDAGSQALSEALRSSFVIVKIIMVLLVAVFFASGIFTVPSQENAIILRFGRPVGVGEQMLLGPGLHWSFPYPIDEKVRIPLGKLQTVTSTAGWYATTPEMELAGEEPYAGPSLNPAVDGYVITADTNIIHARATLSYRISNPLSYALNFAEAPRMVQNALDNALFHASARFTVDQALRHDRLGFKERVIGRVRELAEQQGLGIVVEQGDVELREPRQVKDAFVAVFNAEVERRKTNDIARAYADRVVNTALGTSNVVVNAGRTDRVRRVQEVAADAKYFADQLPYYRSNPEFFMARLKTESMQHVLTNSQDKYFLPMAPAGSSRELRLELNREPEKAAIKSPSS